MGKRNAFNCNRDIVVDIISISLLRNENFLWQVTGTTRSNFPAVQLDVRYINEQSDSAHEWAKALRTLKEIRTSEVDERENILETSIWTALKRNNSDIIIAFTNDK